MKLYICLFVIALGLAQAQDEEGFEDEEIQKGDASACSGTDNCPSPPPNTYQSFGVVRSPSQPSAVPYPAQSYPRPVMSYPPFIRFEDAVYYNFRVGNCYGNRQVKENIYRQPIRHKSRRIRFGWNGYGRYYATCVLVTNLPFGGAKVVLINGGPGESEVALQFLTDVERGINSEVEIWAEDTSITTWDTYGRGGVWVNQRPWGY